MPGSEIFDFGKVKKLSEDLKKGKYNPLRSQVEPVKIDNISPNF